jgi:hypothetical protein
MQELVLAANDSDGSAAGGFGMMIIWGLLYFLPTIVAAARKVTNLGSVAVINVFLGWTCIGWVVALAMAVKTVHPQAPVVVTQQYPYPPNYPPPPQDYPPNYPPTPPAS